MTRSITGIAKGIALAGLISVLSPLALDEPDDNWHDALPKGALVRLGTNRFQLDATEVLQLQFTADGKYLVSLHEDAAVTWNATTGQRLAVSLYPNCEKGSSKRARLEGMSLSLDGKQLALLRGCEIRILDLGSSEQSSSAIPNSGPESACFSPGGDRFYIINKYHGAEVYDLKTGKKTKMDLPCDEWDGRGWLDRACEHLAIADPKKGTLSLAKLGATKWLWQAELPARGKNRSVVRFLFSDDGARIYAIWDDGAIQSWSTETGEAEKPWTVEGLRSTREINLSPSGKLFGIIDNDGMVHVVDRTRRQKLRLTVPADRPGCRWRCLAISPDDKVVAAANSEGGIFLANLDDGKPIHGLDFLPGPVRSCAYSPDNKWLASCDGTNVDFWQLPEGKLCKTIRCPGLVTEFFADGRRVLVAGGDEVSILDLTSLKVETHFPLPKETRWVKLTKHGREVVAISSRGNISVCDVKTGDVLKSFRAPDDVKGYYPIEGGAAVSPDESLVALAGWERIIFVDLGTGKMRTDLTVEESTTGMCSPCFSPDGALLAFAAQGRSWRLWSIGGKRQVWEQRADGAAKDQSVSFSPNGRYFGAPGPGKTVTIYDLVADREVMSVDGHLAPVRTLRFAPDGRAFATGSDDHTLLIWRLGELPSATDTKTANLTESELAECSKRLGERDPSASLGAVSKMVARGDQAVAYLASKVKPVDTPSDKAVSKLIEDLDSDDFATRNAALEGLVHWDRLAERQVRQALKAPASLDVDNRLRQFLDGLTSVPPPTEHLRNQSAVEVLEYIASPKAIQHLEALSKGAKEHRLTQEAAQALSRIHLARGKGTQD